MLTVTNFILGCLFSILAIWLCIIDLNITVYTNKQVGKATFILSIFMGIYARFLDSNYQNIKLILMLLTTTWIFQYFFHKGVFKSLISSIKLYIAFAIGDAFSYYMLVNILKYALDDLRNNITLMVVSNTIAILAIIPVIYLWRWYKEKLTFYKISNIKVLQEVIIALSAIVALLVIAVNFYFYDKYSNNIDIKIVNINILSMFLYFMFITLIMITTNNLILKNKELEYKDEENKGLNIYIDAFKMFSEEREREEHNYKNILIGMLGYLLENDYLGLEKHIYQLIEKNRKINNVAILGTRNIKNPMLRGIICNKIHYAESEDITVSIIVMDEIDNLNMKIFDLCEVIGIYIDNAIEGSRQSEEKILNIIFLRDEEYHSIVIENSFLHQPQLSKIYEKGYTTRNGDNRGRGLWISNNILKNYKNIIHNTSIKNNLFIQELHIKRLNQKV